MKLRSRLSGRSVTIYLPNLNGGGTERLYVALAPYMVDAGLNVTFLLDREIGPLISHVPSSTQIISLSASRTISALPKLAQYLRFKKPDILLSAMEHQNITSIWARKFSGSETKVVVSQHAPLSAQYARGLKYSVIPQLYSLFLSKADAIVAVSVGVAKDLAETSNLKNVQVIYNGVASNFGASRTDQIPDHRWARSKLPIILAAGRLVEGKDYPTLLRAFARIDPAYNLHLLILGDGPMRAQLLNLTRQLGIESRVDLPGFVDNLSCYMSYAKMFVSSSRFEGFGNVLAEALGAGLPIVSTDCPFGPAEILDKGIYGTLVPVGDEERLADAITHTLSNPPDPIFLRQRGAVYSLDNCAAAYLSLFEAVLQTPSNASAPTLESATN